MFVQRYRQVPRTKHDQPRRLYGYRTYFLCTEFWRFREQENKFTLYYYRVKIGKKFEKQKEVEVEC